MGFYYPDSHYMLGGHEAHASPRPGYYFRPHAMGEQGGAARRWARLSLWLWRTGLLLIAATSRVMHNDAVTVLLKGPSLQAALQFSRLGAARAC